MRLCVGSPRLQPPEDEPLALCLSFAHRLPGTGSLQGAGLCLPCYMIFEEPSLTSCNLSWPISLLKSDLIRTPKPQQPDFLPTDSLERHQVQVDGWMCRDAVPGGRDFSRFQEPLSPGDFLGTSLRTASSSQTEKPKSAGEYSASFEGNLAKSGLAGKRPVGKEAFVLEWASVGRESRSP